MGYVYVLLRSYSASYWKRVGKPLALPRDQDPFSVVFCNPLI